MTSPTSGFVADFIRDHVPTGFVNRFHDLTLAGTYTAYDSLTVTVQPLSLPLIVPIANSRTYAMPGQVAEYDPWNVPGRFRAPTLYNTIAQTFRIHGSQIAAQMFEAHFGGLIQARATLLFSGATTDEDYIDVYGPRRCTARLISLSGLLEHSHRRTSNPSNTRADITAVWRQLGPLQAYTP